MFNEAQVVERTKDGRGLIAKLHSEGHPAPWRSHQPWCTRSQTILYLDENFDEVAKAHQYLLPDGTLGASKQPDPYRYFDGETLYWAFHTRGNLPMEDPTGGEDANVEGGRHPNPPEENT
jgi:hypothetical protein